MTRNQIYSVSPMSSGDISGRKLYLLPLPFVECFSVCMADMIFSARFLGTCQIIKELVSALRESYQGTLQQRLNAQHQLRTKERSLIPVVLLMRN